MALPRDFAGDRFTLRPHRMADIDDILSYANDPEWSRFLTAPRPYGREDAIAYLDFETMWPALPVFEGCRPYDQVPVQFSVHFERGDDVSHHEWLAEGPGDPRDELLLPTRHSKSIGPTQLPQLFDGIKP